MRKFIKVLVLLSVLSLPILSQASNVIQLEPGCILSQNQLIFHGTTPSTIYAGHSAGLIHPKEYTGLYYLNYLLGEYDGNLMNQGLDGNQGVEINENQMIKIDKIIDKNNPPQIEWNPKTGTIIKASENNTATYKY